MADAPRAKTSASVLRKLLSPRAPPFYVLTFVVQLLAAVILSRVTSLDFILSLRTIFATVGIGAFLGAWTLSGEEGDVASGRMWASRVSGLPNRDAPVAETPFDAERTAANFPWILVLVAYGVGLFVLAIALPG